MPFGLTNAPATFQRLMESSMGDLYLSSCLLYLDDIVVYSRTYEEHLEKLEGVFQRLKESGLKLKPTKCKLFQRSIKYLGHVISEDGVATDPDKIKAVEQWPVPKNASEVQSFLGFVGFYRRFIRQFSKVARPLHQVVQESGLCLKKRGKQLAPFQWGEAQQQAFEELVRLCTSAPVLAFANFTKPFKLHTDASLDGLGAIIYQEQEGHDRVIAYASRRLSLSEQNYPVHKWFLALKWAVTETFADYLHGATFTAYTDNNPLTYVLSTAKLDATGHRWVAQLANFNFDIKYKCGKKNIDADRLSRVQWPEVAPQEITCQTVTACLEGVQVTNALVEVVCMSSQVVPEVEGTPLESQVVDWQEAQEEDPVSGPVIEVLKGNRDASSLDLNGAQLLRSRDRLELKEDVLYRRRQDDDVITYQIVLPRKLQQRALQGCHDHVGHLGRERTLELIRERFYWPGMTADVAGYVAACGRCLRRKAPTNQRAPLVSISSSQPMEMICIDFLSLEPANGGIENILVVTDHFASVPNQEPDGNNNC